MFLVEIFIKCNKNIIFKFFRVSLVLFIGLNYNIKSIWYRYNEVGSLIPLHFTFERVYKNINYEDTAEYIHTLKYIEVSNKYENNKNLKILEERVHRNYIN